MPDTFLRHHPTAPPARQWSTPRAGYRCRVRATPRTSSDEGLSRIDRPDPDVALALAWAQDGPDAIRRVWERYGTLVHTYCVRSIADRDLAADCEQETFVSAWRWRARFDPGKGSLGAWLLGIARNRVHDTYRGQSRTPVADGSVERLDPPDTASPSDALVQRLLVADTLGQLPARPREVLELAYFEGLSQSRIADRLGLPLGTVKSDVRRALLKLRAQLVEAGDVRA